MMKLSGYINTTDINIAPTTYTVNDLISELGNEVSSYERNGKVLRLYLDNNETFVTCYLKILKKTMSIVQNL